MRAGFARLAAIVGLLLVAAPAAAERTLTIQRFSAAIDVAVDGSITVEETIVARFTGSWNGIYRTIPIEYRTPQGLNYTLRLSVDSITDDSGTSLKYESSRVRHYRKLKIWVPGAVNATRTVRIRYRVANALRFFDEHDELYWNVTGDEWDVPIESAAAVVRLPSGVSGVRATAFRGEYGSTEQNAVTIAGNQIAIDTRGLGFHEGLTAVIGWNPGVVHRPTAVDRTADAIRSNLPLLLPPIVFVLMYRRWQKRGRDPKLAPIVTRYEPPEQMTPAELGTLADGSPDMRDVTATIVDLAVRGYLHIAETDEEHMFALYSTKDYGFTLKKPRAEWNALKPHERKLLEALFKSGDSVTLSALKNKFYKDLPGIKDGLLDNLVGDGLYAARPDKVRTAYIVGGVFLVAGSIVFGSQIMDFFGMQPLAMIVGGVASGIIIAAVGWFMPMRTVKGTRELEKVLGFEDFLARVESDRFDRVIKTPEMFEKFLPYAMALGVESNWAKAFEGIYQQSPSWYTGPGGVHTFSPRAFTSDVSRMSAAAATAMASAPRSSGGSGFSGGSSGGGFGGGGGGGF
jgi:uncharacterized membrane protein